MLTLTRKLEPLCRDAFAPFGDVIESKGAEHFSINAGAIERFHNLATVDVDVKIQGRPLISIVKCNHAIQLPYQLPFMERHPLGSQAFIPMDQTPIIVVVAPQGERIETADIRAFISNGKQGVNYYRATWHMPLVSFKQGQEMVVVDRAGAGDNCEEYYFDDVKIILTD